MPLFEDLKSVFQRQIVSERLVMAFFGIGGLLGLSVPVLIPHQDREAKLLETIYGFGSFAALTAAAALRQTDEKIYQSIKSARLQALKSKMQHQVAFESSINSIEALRQLAAYISTLPLNEQARWISQYGVEGLIEEYLIPQQQQPQAKPKSKGIPNPEVVTLSDEEVSAVTDPAATAKLEMLQNEFPDMVRLDGEWIDELCASSSEPDMTKRINHHFYLAGGTQMGKSTLAGVLINKIAIASKYPALILGNDPKDGITHWLCKFSKLFPGMETCSRWVTYAKEKISDRKAEITAAGTVGGVGEMFLLQDEVDTVFGGGKGFPGLISKDLASELQGFWNYVIKFTAALKCHGIFMGQSPLCDATGFSRPELKSICFISLGGTASYILDNPKDFLSVQKPVLESLRLACQCCEEAGLRYALVVPTRGKPFVGVIPRFNIPNAPQPQTTDSHVPTSSDDWYKDISDWYNSLKVSPTMVELQAKWLELTGKKIDEEGVKLLLEQMSIRRATAS